MAIAHIISMCMGVNEWAWTVKSRSAVASVSMLISAAGVMKSLASSSALAVCSSVILDLLAGSCMRSGIDLFDGLNEAACRLGLFDLVPWEPSGRSEDIIVGLVYRVFYWFIYF